MELEFKVDTKERKQYFTAESFAHPAKMSLPLQLWLIEKYTKPGDTILDPMAGIGTILVGATLGRNIICVELEEKFCWMMFKNAEKIMQRGPQMGYKMGRVDIIQGDARNLEGLLVDKIISSPPYADIERRDRSKEDWWDEEREKKLSGGSAKIAKGYQVDKIITSPPYTNRMDGGTELQKGFKPYSGKATGWFTTRPQNNIGNLPYGQIDKIITSPPYAEAQSGGGIAQKGYQGSKHSPTDLVGKRSYMPEQTGQSEGQISNFPYGNIDAVITSPPYEAQKTGGEQGKGKYSELDLSQGLNRVKDDYLPNENQNNIGNLKSQSYLEAMARVYSQCHKVLRPGGLLILVTKNFIRNKRVIRLDLDTIKLCEQAGFKLFERHKRKLTSQSFWRVIYFQKHPEVEKIEHEDILVFTK